jgi:hypothetical protein
MGQRLQEETKKNSRVSSNRANIDANMPTVSNIKTTPKKKGSKNNCVAKKCKPFLGVLVSTSMSASLPATGACKNKNKVRATVLSPTTKISFVPEKTRQISIFASCLFPLCCESWAKRGRAVKRQSRKNLTKQRNNESVISRH